MAVLGESLSAERTRARTLDELRGHATDALAHHKLPEAIRMVDELPQTAMGKLDRQALTDAEERGTDR